MVDEVNNYNRIILAVTYCVRLKQSNQLVTLNYNNENSDNNQENFMKNLEESLKAREMVLLKIKVDKRKQAKVGNFAC